MRRLEIKKWVVGTCMASLLVFANEAQAETKQRLDSIVSPSYKTVFTYDQSGKNTQRIYYSWSSSEKKMKEEDKETYAYDVNGHLTVRTYYNWKGDTISWKEDKKTEYTYGANGFQASEIFYSWDNMTNKWFEGNKNEYTYDASGNMTVKIHYGWSSNRWITYTKEEYTYAGKIQIRLITYNWDGEDWKPTKKDEDNQTTRTIYNWNNATNQWKAVQKYEYTSYPDGYTSYKWEDQINDWKPEGQTVVDGNEKITYWWNGATWREDGKAENVYDGENLILVANYLWNMGWNDGSREWVGNVKYEYTYGSYSQTDLLLPVDFDMNKRLTLDYYVGTHTDSAWKWSFISTTTYYWSNQEIITTGINNYEMQNTNYVIYPNPANGQLFISTGDFIPITIKLYDMLGQEVLTQNANGKTGINISHLPNGVYTVSVLSEGKVMGNSKIAKQ